MTDFRKDAGEIRHPDGNIRASLYMNKMKEDFVNV